MSKSTIKIGLRSNHESFNGIRTICIQYLAYGASTFISLNIRVSPEQWNKSSLTVRKTFPFAKEYNKLILDAYHQANSILIENFFSPLSTTEFTKVFRNRLRNKSQKSTSVSNKPSKDTLTSNESCTPIDVLIEKEIEVKIKEKGKKKKKVDFYDFIEKEIEILKPSRSKGTISNYNKLLNMMKRWKPRLSCDEINLEYIQKFHNHEIKVGNLLSTVYKKHANFKFLIGIAVDKELILKNPYEKFEIKKITKAQNNDILNEAEVKKLQKAYDSNNYSGLKKDVLKCFLFSCYTSISFSDINNIKYSNLHPIIIEDKEYYLLRNDRVKTNVTYKIPLVSPVVISLIGKGKATDRIFGYLENHVANRYIKEIMKDLNIHKNMTFHRARHTFRTIAAKKGIRDSIAERIMGHAEGNDIRDIYTHLHDEDIIKEMLDKWTV